MAKLVENEYFGLIPFSKELYDFKSKKKAMATYLEWMYSITSQMFKYNGLPDTIPQRDLETIIQSVGWAYITDKYNNELWAFFGGLGGKGNGYYRPTIITISNPYLNYFDTLDIENDGVMIKNDDMYGGLDGIHRRYATLLVELDLSIRNATINTRLISLLSGKTNRVVDSLKELIKAIERGDLGVVSDTMLTEDALKALPYQSNQNIFAFLIELRQYIKASWLNDIGLNANYNMKRESLNSNETQLNDDMLHPFIDNMLKCRREALAKINEKYGTNITVEFNSAWKTNEVELDKILSAIGGSEVPQTKEEIKEEEQNEETISS